MKDHMTTIHSTAANIGSIVFAFCLSFAAVAPAQVQISADQLRERGALFYAPFEGSPNAAFAIGQAEPWVVRDVLYGPGMYGLGIQCLKNDSRTVRMPDGTQKKYTNANSMLVYEALGNIYNRRGTLAFWVLSPWDASDQDLLTGAGQSGPTVIEISAKNVYPAFFAMPRWKNNFGLLFEGAECRKGDLPRFGSLGQKLIPLWKKDQWHHVAVTWDDRRGFAVYHNGNLIDKFEGDIEWDMLEPETIAPGAATIRLRDLWPVNAAYMFDEFIVFCRPLTPDEVLLVRDGKYAELRALKAGDWPVEAETRRRQLHFNENNNCPVIRASEQNGVKATIRQCAVEEVDMKFHRAFALLDGQAESSVVFNDGEVPFDVLARFRFPKAGCVNHMVTDMKSAKNSYVFESNPSNSVAALADGRCHLKLDERERMEMGVFFKGDSEAREIGFYDIRPGVSVPSQGTTLDICDTLPRGQFKDADKVLLTALNPCDQPALYADKIANKKRWPLLRKAIDFLVRKPEKNKTMLRKAMDHTFIVVAPQEKDCFLESLRLVLRLKPKQSHFNAIIRVHDPQIDGRVALDMDFAVEWSATGAALPLDLTLGAPGLIVPANGHLVLDLILDTDCEIEYGPGVGSRIELAEGDAKRIGHEFAQAQIRNLFPMFGRRLNQNRFLQSGEDKEKNPVWRGLTLAEKYDPDNEMVKSWFGWSRLQPWPAYDFSYLEKEPGPKWAVYMREAARSMQAIAHWWLDHRCNDNGYIVGGGNQWNDITDFYSTFLTLGVTVSDQRVIEMIQRYQDAHWNSGRMKNGYTTFCTDALHAMEEATEIQPCLEILRPGLPRNMYRNLNTARNYSKWLGKNSFGHTHFRSNFFNADNMITNGIRGRDRALSEGATVPGRFVWWYNGHPEIARLLTAYADSWLADTLRGTKAKPAGVIPAEIQFETDQLFSSSWDDSRSQMADMLMSAYSLTGEQKYLEPIKILLTRKAEASHAKWSLSHSRNFVHYRIITADPSYDSQLREIAKEAYEGFKADSFFQRGFETVEGQALCKWVVDYDEADLMEMLKYVIRNNRRGFIPYTITDPPTDRVNPWGREVLPVVMLGGRPFGILRFSNPIPSAAFAWEGTDPDVVSMVFERNPTAFKMLVYNFKEKPVTAGLRVLQLPEGRYRLATAFDENGDRKPDETPQTSHAQRVAKEIELRRFSPTSLEIPSRRTLWVDLSLIQERPKTMRPDLAVAPGSIDGDKIIAQIHNLGCVTAPASVVRLMDDGEHALAEVQTPEVPGISGFDPQIREVAITLPAGVRAEKCVLVVDPDNRVDEINEANNRYPLSLGVPPPVETPPKKLVL